MKAPVALASEASGSAAFNINEDRLTERIGRWLVGGAHDQDAYLRAPTAGNLPRLAKRERAFILPRWWGSSDSELRVVAAHYFLQYPGDEEPSRDALIEFLSASLHDDNPQVRQLSAFGLALSFARRPLEIPLSERPPELAALDDALTDARSRTPALRALFGQKPALLHQRPEISLTQIATVLNDPEALVGDLARAFVLGVSLGVHYDNFADILPGLLRSLEIDEDLFDEVVGCVPRMRRQLLHDFITDPTAPNARRIQLLVRRVVYLDASWTTWNSLWHAPFHSPEVTACALRILAERGELDYRGVLDMARHPSLPDPLRVAVFRILWNSANDIADRVKTEALPIVLAWPDLPQIARDAFDGSLAWLYSGPSTPETTRTILRMLHEADANADPRYRGMLAMAVPPGFVPAGERRFLVETLLALASTDFPGKAALWWKIDTHLTGNKLLGAEIRQRVRDENLPMTTRIGLLRLRRRNLSDTRVAIFDFASKVRLNDGERAELIRVLFDVFGSIQGMRAPRLAGTFPVTDESWRDVLATAEFRGQDVNDLVAVAVNPHLSEIVRRTALAFLEAEIRIEAVACRKIRGKLLELGPDVARRAEVVPLLTLIVGCVWIDSDLLNLCLTALRSPSVPEAAREDLVKAFARRLTRENARAAWEVGHADDSPRVRAALLRAFIDVDLLPRLRFLEKLVERVQSADTPEERVDADRAWSDLRPFGALIGEKNASVLLNLAARRDIPSSLRECAGYMLGRVNLTLGDRRNLWLHLRAHATEVWSDDVLRNSLTRSLEKGIQDYRLKEVLSTGPRHALWSALVELAILPDQSLVSEVLANIRLPQEERTIAAFCQWRAAQALRIPEAAGLALLHVVYSSRAQDRLVRVFNDAFARAKAHHSEEAELLRSFLSVACRPPGIIVRVTDVLRKVSADLDELGNGPGELSDLLRYAQLEAQLVARDRRDYRPDAEDGRDPDVQPGQQSALLPITEVQSAATIAARLRDRVCERSVPHLPNVPPEELAAVLRETIAPAILIPHYLRVHPHGLPLLAAAVRAASAGQKNWERWRFDRPEACAQISSLDEAGVAAWRENLSVPVHFAEVPDDIRRTAATIRERFRQALDNDEVPSGYRALVEADENPLRLLDKYRAICRYLIGPAIGGQGAALPEESLASLPASISPPLRKALEERDRQELIAVRYRIERAVDLLRLLQCDEEALAHNELRACGEARDGSAESAVARITRLRQAFQRPPTRQLRQTSGGESHQLDAAFDAALGALESVKTFMTDKQLVLTECTDFKTLIEIGHYPYGQGSCQSYFGGELNRALLAYVVDAMTKAVMLRTAPTRDEPQGMALARAIIRLGTSQEANAPVIVLERAYAAGRDGRRFDAAIREGMRELARRRGWTVAVPDNDSERLEPFRRGVVAIPASQNEVQYEDGAAALIDGGGVYGVLNGSYALRVAYLP